jgi:hypothetical protein
MIDYDRVRLRLRTAATSGPIVHPPGDMLSWSAMVMMTPAGDNSWLVHQSSLAVLPADTSGTSRKNGRRSENFAHKYLKDLKGSLTCRKILRHGTSGFTSHPKEGVLRIFIVLKNPSPWPGLKPRPLGPVASRLTTTLPRQLEMYSSESMVSHSFHTILPDYLVILIYSTYGQYLYLPPLWVQSGLTPLQIGEDSVASDCRCVVRSKHSDPQKNVDTAITS